jgi:membrane fusion protein (multidrug efflux system)
MRKAIIIGSGIAILIGSVLISNFMAKKNKPKAKDNEFKTTRVFTQNVKLGDVEYSLSATGTLLAVDRFELFAEVQGIMEKGTHSFKSGVSFNKGETVIDINSEDFQANLISQKSTFQNLMISLLADLKLDYPASFEKWETYVENIDLRKTLQALPEVSNKQEKLFISGRNVYSSYYSVKNTELTLSKYTIKAPFNGTLTEALVNPGSVIRPGQKLGEFINPTQFELELGVSNNLIDQLQIGKSVKVKATNGNSKTWNGKVIRINDKIDSQNQTVKVFVSVAGDGLEEGLFLEASIKASKISNAIEIDRSLIQSDNKVYIAKDNQLALVSVKPMFFGESKAIVKGLENGQKLITKSIPGAFEGMKVITE